MNYLQLVQEAVRYSGARVEEPTTLVGVDGVEEIIAQFVEQAWTELQLEREDWLWNTRSQFTGILKQDTDRMWLRGEIAGPDNTFTGFVDATQTPVAITPAEIALRLQECSVRISESDVLKPENYLSFIPWKLWYDIEDTTPTNTPSYYTVDSSGVMRVKPAADKDYRLYVEAPEVPQTLTVDADVPEGLVEYLHRAIVWRAVLYYGMYITDNTVIEMARQRYKPYKKRLERQDMPRVNLIKDALYRRG